MPDNFAQHSVDLPDPLAYAAAVTPSDSVELPTHSRALHVGTAGDVKVTTVGGSVVTFKLGAGWHPIRAKLVWAAGTTAANIVAVW